MRVSPGDFERDRGAYMLAFDAVVAARPAEETSRVIEAFLRDVFEASPGLDMKTLFALPCSDGGSLPGPSASTKKRANNRLCEVCGRCANYGIESKKWCAQHARDHAGARRL